MAGEAHAPPPVTGRLWGVLTLTLAASLVWACLAAAALAAPRLNLVHVAVYDSCSLRTYAYHWQHRQRQPETLRYDFVNSPDSLVVVALWLNDGPSWNISRALPVDCTIR